MSYLLPRVIPTLLLKKNGLYKGMKYKNHKYVGDPINTVKIFNQKEIDEIMLLDIEASLTNSEPNYSLLEQIATEAFMPLSYGGGINRLEQAKKLFSLGIEKLVLGSVIFHDLNVVKEIVSVYGAQSICISIDVKKDIFKKYKLYSYCGTKKQKEKFQDFLEKLSKFEFGEILINSIEQDGTLKGYDTELINQVSNKFRVPVIASCGASSLSDFKLAIQNGAYACAAGSMFVYQGVHKAVLISYPKYEKLRELFKEN